METVKQIILDKDDDNIEIVNKPYTIQQLSGKILPNDVINEQNASFILRNEPLNSEQFKEYHLKEAYKKIKKIEISNLGRVRITNADDSTKIAEQIDNEWDYDKNDYKIGYLRLKEHPGLGYVYRLVAETWLKKDPAQEKEIFDGTNANNWEVHHITNNGYDNKPENLIWLKRKLHNLIPKSR